MGHLDRSRTHVTTSDLFVAEVRQKKPYEGSGMHMRGNDDCNITQINGDMQINDDMQKSSVSCNKAKCS